MLVIILLFAALLCFNGYFTMTNTLAISRPSTVTIGRSFVLVLVQSLALLVLVLLLTLLFT